MGSRYRPFWGRLLCPLSCFAVLALLSCLLVELLSVDVIGSTTAVAIEAYWSLEVPLLAIIPLAIVPSPTFFTDIHE